MILVVLALAIWLGLWWLNQRLVAIDTGANKTKARAINLVVPLLFGVTIFVLWELLVRGLDVSPVLLPPTGSAKN